MFYFEVLEELHKNNIRYLIVGGLAVNLHNVPRMTHDIDFLLSMSEDNILAFVRTMKEMGYVPRVPVNPELLSDSETRRSWIEEKNMKAFSFYNQKENYKVVDIVLTHPLDFEKAFENKCVKMIKDIPLYVVSLNDLMEMKKASGRNQDLNDIEMLKTARKLLEEQNG